MWVARRLLCIFGRTSYWRVVLKHCYVNRIFEFIKSIIKFPMKEVIKYSFEYENVAACLATWSAFSFPEWTFLIYDFWLISSKWRINYSRIGSITGDKSVIGTITIVLKVTSEKYNILAGKTKNPRKRILSTAASTLIQSISNENYTKLQN